jgi:hypothetical protein
MIDLPPTTRQTQVRPFFLRSFFKPHDIDYVDCSCEGNCSTRQACGLPEKDEIHKWGMPVLFSIAVAGITFSAWLFFRFLHQA